MRSTILRGAPPHEFAAENRRNLPSEADAILNALPNPVLLVAPDGRIIDANMAAKSFFDISAQFLQRQSLETGAVWQPAPRSDRSGPLERVAGQ